MTLYKYFLRIEVAQSNNEIIISQMKYAFNILEKIILMNSNLIYSPWIPIPNLYLIMGRHFIILINTKTLVGKLNDLTITCSDIFFVVGVVSQFPNYQYNGHWNVFII